MSLETHQLDGPPLDETGRFCIERTFAPVLMQKTTGRVGATIAFGLAWGLIIRLTMTNVASLGKRHRAVSSVAFKASSVLHNAGICALLLDQADLICILGHHLMPRWSMI
jgi:hypothetical protein